MERPGRRERGMGRSANEEKAARDPRISDGLLAWSCLIRVTWA
jgi:hypothetical protein